MNNSGAAGGVASYPQASLYIGDLHPEVQENHLFEKFSKIGPVLSIRICRDAVSKKSLGYGYINYQNQDDAEKALDNMNFESIHGNPIRLMWSQRDPTLRRTGTGNIFIKNLAKDINTKSLYDTFKAFGNILSCKVANSENGESKGFGFIHFDSEEAAVKAIELVNKKKLGDKIVYVGRFKSRAQWVAEMGGGRKFTNVFIKNMGNVITEEEFRKLVEEHGKVNSVYLAKDENGKAKGYGFVAYEKPEEAAIAVKALHESDFSGQKLYAGRAQKKEERHAELKQMYEARKREILQRSQGVNLYVKNLDESMTEAKLKDEFSKFGRITSLKLMTDGSGVSRGFAFVCYTTPEEATKAVTEMNGKMLGNKPLYVAMAQRKEERKAQLATQYMQKLTNRMNSGPMGQMYTPSNQGYFLATNSYSQPPTGFMANVRGPPTGSSAPMSANRYPSAAYGPTGFPRYPYPKAGNSRANYSQQAANRAVQHQQFAPPPYSRGAMGVPGMGDGSGSNYHFTNAVRNRPVEPHPQTPAQLSHYHQQGHPQQYRTNVENPLLMDSGASGNGLLGGQTNLGNLASQSTDEQKQSLGEKLFPHVQSICAEEAGKVTGMLLEMDNSELLILLDSPKILEEKINEALVVLKNEPIGGN